MTRPVNEPGYQSKVERELAAGYTAYKAEQEKAKKARELAADKKKKLDSLKAKKQQIDSLESQLAFQARARTAQQNAYNIAITPGSGASAERIAELKLNYTNISAKITSIESSIKKANAEYLAIEKSTRSASETYVQDGRERVKKALADAKKTNANPSGNKNTKAPPATEPPPPIAVRFNAPMVTSAYFRTKNHSTNSLVARGAIPKSAASLIDSSFGDGNTNRGFIIPNKRAQDAAMAALDDKSKATSGYKVPFGFRFHYNPQFVQQSYGSITGISPELIESGKDKTNMITTPASSSSISITLYLNRIEDMNALATYAVSKETVLDKDGKTPRTSVGKINSDADSLLWYPEVVSAADRKLIKDFGTMYDLDFLFKAINGEMGGYKSPLRGVKTGDVGWLNGIAVEVHMGRKLRYLARVTNISVNHLQFTENMVPTLTTVVLTMARFHDAMVKD